MPPIHPDLLAILRCPINPTATLSECDQGLRCSQCGVIYPINNGIPCLLPQDGILPSGVASIRNLPCSHHNKAPNEKK